MAIARRNVKPAGKLIDELERIESLEEITRESFKANVRATYHGTAHKNLQFVLDSWMEDVGADYVFNAVRSWIASKTLAINEQLTDLGVEEAAASS